MLEFAPLFWDDGISVEHQLFHIVNGHKYNIWCYKLNIAGHPFHGVEFFEEAIAVASDNFDLIVSLFVNELLKEHPDVI